LALHGLDVLFRRIGQTVSWDTLSTGDRVNIYVLEDQDLLQLTNYVGHKLRRLHQRSAHPFVMARIVKTRCGATETKITTIDRVQFEFKARCSLDKWCTQGG
jgi:hypothetical protein